LNCGGSWRNFKIIKHENVFLLLNHIIFVLSCYGILTFIRNVVLSYQRIKQTKKGKAKKLIITTIMIIPVMISIPFVIVYILQGINVVGNNFDILGYLNNASKIFVSQLENTLG